MRTLRALTIALPALLLAAPAGAAAAEPDAQLSVHLSDGVEEARSGDVLEYVVTVENDGPTPFSGVVSLRAGNFVELGAAEGTVEDGAASWALELPAGGSATFEAVALVAEVPADAYQVVGLAEVTGASGEVVVRAADADAVPGAEAPPAVAGMTPAATGLPVWLLGAGVVSAAVLGAASLAIFGVLIARRHRRLAR